MEYTGSETTLKDNGNGEHMSLHVSKLIEHTTPKVNPNVNYGLWVIMMCRYRFYCNKHTALVLDVGRVPVHVWWQGLWEFSASSAQF